MVKYFITTSIAISTLLLGVPAFAQKCGVHFLIHDIKSGMSMDVEEISISEQGLSSRTININDSDFIAPIPELDSRRNIYTNQNVQREVTVNSYGVSIRNLNTAKEFIFNRPLQNYHGIMSVDHKFWLMPYSSNKIVIWIFSRLQNNIAEIFLEEGQQFLRYDYESINNIPMVRLHILKTAEDGVMYPSAILVNLYTMKAS